MANSIQSETFRLSVPEGQQFDVCVKHYILHTKSSSTRKDKSKLVIAFMAHGVGQHKELFEPFLNDLCELQEIQAQSLDIVVSEAYAIDCPNHGDSALLNEQKLISNNNRFTSPVDYAQSFLALIESGLIRDSEMKKFAFIGFSAGAVTAILTAKEIIERRDPVQFSTIILLEAPLLATPKATYLERNAFWLTNICPSYLKLLNKKRDKWSSEKEALEDLRNCVPYNTWDARCLEVFIKSGLRSLPTGFYPNETTGVTLKCFKAHESQAFASSNNWPILALAEALPDICRATPIHLVFGRRSRMRPSDEEIALLSAGKDDKYPCDKYASVMLISNAGHLIVQDAPRTVAICVINALNKNRIEEICMSKL